MPSWRSAGTGAAAGAAAGSFFPVIGTGLGAGIGALAGGLFGGGDDDKKDDQNPALDIDAITKQLSGNAARSTKRGSQLGTAGDEAVRTASNYFKMLAGGDPSAIAAATAPERRMVIDQYDTARRSVSEFGPRGGGAAEATSGLAQGQADTLSDITANARNTGATALASIGATEQGLALSADQLASADLSTLISAALGNRQLDTQESGQNAMLTGQLAEGLGLLLGQFLTRKKAA